MVSRFLVPDLGVGVGFRTPHYEKIVVERPEMDWFEVISENFMVDGGSPLHYLERLLDGYTVVPHGVSLSLGSEQSAEHVERLAAFVQRVNPPWFSDHLCFTQAGGVNSHDLLPVPYTAAVLNHMVERIQRVQDRVGRVFAIENPSSYLRFSDSEMPEWAFLAELVDRADCAILLDVNNVFVSAHNHGFDAAFYLDQVPADRIVQVHLAGHMVHPKGYRLDTHDHPVCDAVWGLYARLIRRVGPISTLIEWDDNIPSFERLQQEVAHAKSVRDAALGGDSASN